jgi:hypothetical protein
MLAAHAPGCGQYASIAESTNNSAVYRVIPGVRAPRPLLDARRRLLR